MGGSRNLPGHTTRRLPSTWKATASTPARRGMKLALHSTGRRNAACSLERRTRSQPSHNCSALRRSVLVIRQALCARFGRSVGVSSPLGSAMLGASELEEHGLGLASSPRTSPDAGCEVVTPWRRAPSGRTVPRSAPLADSRDRRDRDGSHVLIAPDPGAASGSPPFEPRPLTLPGIGSMFPLGPETRTRRVIEFLHPTPRPTRAGPTPSACR
jgi:hypothetical protein